MFRVKNKDKMRMLNSTENIDLTLHALNLNLYPLTFIL